jgi:hypothetical protein
MARGALDCQITAERLHAFAHGTQPDAGAIKRLQIEASAIISQGERDLFVVAH